MLTIVLALTLTSAPTLTATQSEVVQRIEKKLLAPCCYTQSIAQHGSDIAVEMRNEVTQMVVQGQSEDEIVGHFRRLYGERILIVPDGRTGTILYAIPVATVAVGGLLLVLTLEKMLRSETGRIPPVVGTSAVVEDALREKIQREVGEPL